MIREPPLFTCFTPTYNREESLRVVYESLQLQSLQNFEWLIVDDGSSDGTEKLIRTFSTSASFPIRYIRKENGGMHTAINLGAAEAHGKFFLKCDSDDRFLPESLERFIQYWEEIPIASRDRFVGVTVHCIDSHGRIVGDYFPADRFDSRPFELYASYRIRGEKWGFQRTEVLRRYPFPVFPGEKRVPASLIWNRIGRDYLTRYVNDALRVYEIHEDSVTKNSQRARARSWQGTSLYYDELSSLPIPRLERLKASINYLRFSLQKRGALRAILASSRKILAVVALLPALVLVLLDVRTERKSD